MNLNGWILITALICATDAFAARNCDQLMNEFQQMQLAQQSIIQSLVSNHDMMAGQLENTAMELDFRGGKQMKETTVSMKKSAAAYRLRAQNSREIAMKLDLATTDLSKRLKVCMKD